MSLLCAPDNKAHLEGLVLLGLTVYQVKLEHKGKLVLKELLVLLAVLKEILEPPDYKE
jgi:hypothetical protein